jgi:hypothetical protein
MTFSYGPAHSCEHCTRIVLRREHFNEDVCRIKLPHTSAEIEEAERSCELIRTFSRNWQADDVYEQELRLRLRRHSTSNIADLDDANFYLVLVCSLTITVCIALGLIHLWVDCFCIIQDDEEDLMRELSDMPQIYQRA